MKNFGGGGGAGGMAQLMKQANQMQMKMKQTQDQLAKATYTGVSGGEAVKVTVNGDHLVQDLKIDAEVFKSGDAEMLQDLLRVAFNDAVQKAKDTSQKEMEKITGGIGIPGLF